MEKRVWAEEAVWRPKAALAWMEGEEGSLPRAMLNEMVAESRLAAEWRAAPESPSSCTWDIQNEPPALTSASVECHKRDTGTVQAWQAKDFHRLSGPSNCSSLAQKYQRLPAANLNELA